MPAEALDVFISYSPEDETLRQQLEEQLVRLRGEGLLGTWHDRRITGEQWRGWSDRDLISADLVLLIVSAPFLESGYCHDREIRQALERHAWGRARLVPIIARPCDWSTAPFAGLATLPQEVGPVTEWHSRDDAWEDVGQGLREIALEVLRARFEDTATFRRVVLNPSREEDRPAEPPLEEVSGSRRLRFAIAGGIVAILAALAAVYFFWVGRPQQPGGGIAPAQTAEVQAGRVSTAAGRQAGAADASERRPAPRPGVPPAAGPGAAEAPAAPGQTLPPAGAAPGDRPEDPPPEIEAGSEELSPAVAETEAGEAGAASGAAEDAAAPAPAAESRQPRDLERALGILAAPGAEGEAECLAVLVAGDVALTSGACARESTVVVMGGNALTATRDEIFDLEPREPLPADGVQVVRLLQGPGESYGLAATRFEEGFEYESLDAHYVAASVIRSAECVAAARLAEIEDGGRAYVEDAVLDRYLLFVEEAADEAISLAGAQWAELLPEVLDDTGEDLTGFVCALPQRPAGNLVFSAEGRVVGIGYPCEPFERLEPEVRDRLPSEIGRLDLDCVASLDEVREQLPGARIALP